MKQLSIAFACLFISISLSSQVTWTWLKGPSRMNGYGVYGTRGVSSASNFPGNRTGQATWKDNAGNIWIFGGSGYSRNDGFLLNDLWKYSPATDQWTWITGSQLSNDLGNFGIKGIASPSNSPRARTNAASWIDNDGNFWIYGGQAYAIVVNATPTITLNDLWKYTPSTGLWTWMGGQSSEYSVGQLNYPPVFGTAGVAGAGSSPGSRRQTSYWKDKAGDFWLFGGYGYNTSFTPFNDLWKYSVSTGLWTFVSGDATVNATGNYGTKGQPGLSTRPPSRISASGWCDSQNDFWIFGGFNYNDLWRYSTATGQWTWMKGDSSNPRAQYKSDAGGPVNLTPGPGKYSAAWQDENDQFWIYGRTNNINERYADVWKYDRIQNNWEWVSGDSVVVPNTAVYGVKNVPALTNRPGADLSPSVWLDADKQLNLRANNIIWKYQYSIRQWAWISGDTSVNNTVPAAEFSIVGTKGVSAPDNLPISRKFGATWKDKSGFLWMFGGYTAKSPTGYLNDLWRYDPARNEWAWMGGDTIRNSLGSAGMIGVPSVNALPSARQNAATWTDKEGNFWLFGGTQASDFWKFNPFTLEWTLIRSNVSTVYGTLGIPAPENTPGPRFEASYWTDTAGNLLLTGGKANQISQPLNEVWSYNIASGMWTWIGGNKNPQINGEGRTGAASWIDAAGKLWSFGGRGSGTSADYNTNQIRSSYNAPVASFFLEQNDRGLYGVKGVEGSATRPPARRDAIGWSDGAGNQYIFGGQFDTLTYIYLTPQYFNDIWKYNQITSRWTWIGGDSLRNQSGDYGKLGVPSASNKAGARSGSQSWSDPSTGRLWIFSGDGYPENGVTQLRDMLLISAGDAALPVRFGSFNALQQQGAIALTWTTLQEQNASRFIVERSADGTSYTAIGVVNAAGTTNSVSNYAFIDYSPLVNNNYYRLRQIDADNHFMYSEVKLVLIKSALNTVTVLQNPVQDQLKLQFNLGSTETVSIQLKATTGQQVLSKTASIATGNSKIAIDITGFRSGLYYLYIAGKSFNQTISIFKK
jgi:hypothetical protein